jgi:hypothetical protein
MAVKTSAGRRKSIYALLILFGPAIFLIFIATRGCEHRFKKLEDYGKGINYSFTDAYGTKYTQKDFENNIVIIMNIQETCPDSCGVSLWSFDRLVYQDVAKKRRGKKEVKIISFATDINGNPVTDLTNLKQLLESEVVEYDPTIWFLASGNSKPIYNITSNKVNLMQKGEEYYGGEAYQELMLLFDKENHLRMALNGNTEGMVRKMKEHVALLKKEYDQNDARRNK